MLEIQLFLDDNILVLVDNVKSIIDQVPLGVLLLALFSFPLLGFAAGFLCFILDPVTWCSAGFGMTR